AQRRRPRRHPADHDLGAQAGLRRLRPGGPRRGLAAARSRCPAHPGVGPGRRRRRLAAQLPLRAGADHRRRHHRGAAHHPRPAHPGTAGAVTAAGPRRSGLAGDTWVALVAALAALGLTPVALRALLAALPPSLAGALWVLGAAAAGLVAGCALAVPLSRRLGSV